MRIAKLPNYVVICHKDRTTGRRKRLRYPTRCVTEIFKYGFRSTSGPPGWMNNYNERFCVVWRTGIKIKQTKMRTNGKLHGGRAGDYEISLWLRVQNVKQESNCLDKKKPKFTRTSLHYPTAGSGKGSHERPTDRRRTVTVIFFKMTGARVMNH